MAFETKYLNDWIVVIKCEGSQMACVTGTVTHLAAGTFKDDELTALKNHLRQMLSELGEPCQPVVP